jgi:hypothetical protein
MTTPTGLSSIQPSLHDARPQNTLIWFFSCALLAICLAAACAKPKTLTFKTDDTNYSISFDSARIPEHEMRDLIILSPVVTNYAGIPGMDDFWAVGSTTGTILDKSLVALPLETCLKVQPAYTDCDHNEIGSANFLHNASINLQKSREGLAWLRALQYPKDLEPVVSFLQSQLASSLAIEEMKFKYYSRWDDKALTEALDDVHPEEVCADVFKSLRAAHTDKEKYAIVRTQWRTCVTQHASRHHYPTEVWDKFLQDYGIKEAYKETMPDD